MSDQKTFFEDSASRLFERCCPIEVVEAAESGTFPDALWSELELAGFGLTLTSESAGGIGATLADASAILEQAGRAAAPGPILETMIGNWLLGEAGLEPLGGPVEIYFAEAGGNHSVSWLHGLSAIVTIMRDGDGIRIGRDAPAVFQETAVPDTIGEARFAIARKSPPDGSYRLEIGYDRVLNHASVLNAARSLGALEWVLERTIAYASERKQFGREIGKFQVIQQHLAELAGSVAAARAIITEAADQPGQPALAAAARSRLGDTIDTAVSIGHQVHGAIGFSREYPLNYRTRRLMTWRDIYGSTPFWRRKLSAELLAAGAEGIWPAIVAAA
jgi:acyl-CoA dehydrogenase